MTEASPQPDLGALRDAIASGDPVRAMPALTQLRFCESEDAVPLLVLGTAQKPFLVRSLSCSGLGYKRTEQGWGFYRGCSQRTMTRMCERKPPMLWPVMAWSGLGRCFKRHFQPMELGWCVAAFFRP